MGTLECAMFGNKKIPPMPDAAKLIEEFGRVDTLGLCCSKKYASVYRQKHRLGAGNFAEVYLAERKDSHRLVAAKTFKKRRERAFIHEVRMLNRLPLSPYVTNIYEYFTKPQLIIIMEYIEGKELFDKIMEIYKDTKKYSESSAAMLVRQILEAVKFMHASGVCHRDLKPENLMLEDSGALKVTDFGISVPITSLDEKVCGIVGTKHYMATDILALSKEPLGHKTGYPITCDEFSVGIVMYVLLTGKFPHKTNFDRYQGKITFNKTQDRWNELSPNAEKLVMSLAAPDPTNRITATDALNHPWFADTLYQPEKYTETENWDTVFMNLKKFRLQMKFRRSVGAVRFIHRTKKLAQTHDAISLPTDGEDEETMDHEELERRLDVAVSESLFYKAEQEHAAEKAALAEL